MKHADILIIDAWVLTMDAQRREFNPGYLAIKGSQITAAGPMAEAAAWTATRTLDAKGGIVLPGLINTHTHAAMTCFRGMADDLPLMDWLQDHIFPAEARLDHAQVKTGTLLACAEMILSGTTCFCDMYLFEDAVAEAAHQAGMRAVVGEVLYDFPSPNYGPIEAGFAYTERMLAKWHNDPLITIAVEPHSPYLCAPDLLRRAVLPVARKALNHDNLQIGMLKLRPLSHIELQDVWLGPPQGFKKPMLSVKRIVVRHDISQVGNGMIRVEQVQVVASSAAASL